jgi:hypothetical protein
MSKTVEVVKQKADKFIAYILNHPDYWGKNMNKADLLLKLDIGHNDATILWAYLRTKGFKTERSTILYPQPKQSPPDPQN